MDERLLTALCILLAYQANPTEKKPRAVIDAESLVCYHGDREIERVRAVDNLSIARANLHTAQINALVFGVDIKEPA